jgi:hypothetical protein
VRLAVTRLTVPTRTLGCDASAPSARTIGRRAGLDRSGKALTGRGSRTVEIADPRRRRRGLDGSGLKSAVGREKRRAEGAQASAYPV